MNILYLNNIMDVGGVEKCIIQLSKLLKEDNKIIVATAGGELIRELESLNVKHYKIFSTDSKNPISIVENIINILKIIKKEHIDIVHSHHRMTTFYAKIISKFIKVKVVHTQHLCIEDKFLFTRIVLRKTKVITVSNGAKDVLIEKCGLKKEYITTIYNTVETENMNKNIDPNLINFKKQGNFVVAQISRIVDYKGVYDFIEIVKITVEKEKNIRFVLIGDGPERKNIERKIKEYNLNDKVLLLGNKDNVITQLKYIDLILLCSYVEGLPLVPIEAFSQGVPVIGTNIGGTNEEIKDGINGYLVEKKDINTFVDNILQLYSNKNKYEILSKNSSDTFKSLFNKETYKSNHIDFYKNVRGNKL